MDDGRLPAPGVHGPVGTAAAADRTSVVALAAVVLVGSPATRAGADAATADAVATVVDRVIVLGVMVTRVGPTAAALMGAGLLGGRVGGVRARHDCSSGLRSGAYAPPVHPSARDEPFWANQRHSRRVHCLYTIMPLLATP